MKSFGILERVTNLSEQVLWHLITKGTLLYKYYELWNLMRFVLHYRNALWRINFEACRFNCFLKIVLNIYRALCFYVYLVGENVFMYYLVHFSFSSSFFKALVAKE